jgi:hypothetical protein
VSKRALTGATELCPATKAPATKKRKTNTNFVKAKNALNKKEEVPETKGFVVSLILGPVFWQVLW